MRSVSYQVMRIWTLNQPALCFHFDAETHPVRIVSWFVNSSNVMYEINTSYTVDDIFITCNTQLAPKKEFDYFQPLLIVS